MFLPRRWEFKFHEYIPTVPLQILTKDSVTVYVNAIMYYKVRDSNKAVANVDDYSNSTRLLAATTLRNILGTRNLGEILSERDSIAEEMKVHIPLGQNS